VGKTGPQRNCRERAWPASRYLETGSRRGRTSQKCTYHADADHDARRDADKTETCGEEAAKGEEGATDHQAPERVVSGINVLHQRRPEIDHGLSVSSIEPCSQQSRPEDEESNADVKCLVSGVESSVVEPLRRRRLEVVITGLGQGNVVEDDGEGNDKEGDGEAAPLHAEQIQLVGAGEEGHLCDDGRYSGTDSVEPLGEVEASLRQLTWTGKTDEQVCGHFKAGNAEGEDKVGDDEARVRSQDG
jgi:hypothetical protein